MTAATTIMEIFMTGVTGYIGGDLLYLINETHPTWMVSCLIRDPEKEAKIISTYPNVRTIQGNLDSVDVIENECAKTNIVYHCASSDHTASAEAIARGLARNPLKQVFWIHTSGAGILTFRNFAEQNFEVATTEEKIYDDWDGIDDLTSLPDKALHRHVDKLILHASSGNEDHVKTAIVCPPAIYGPGRGTGNFKSVQINVAVKIALKNGQALQMGDGNNIWHGVHIHDLSQLYILLGEAALQHSGCASWNQKGYYFAESEAFRWGDVMQHIADIGYSQRYLTTSKVQSVTFAEAKRHHEWFPYLCGTTSRGVGKRARLLLGWSPVAKPLKEEVLFVIGTEAKALGLSRNDDV